MTEKDKPWWAEAGDIIKAGGAIVGGIATIAGAAAVLGTAGAVAAGGVVVGTAGVVAWRRWKGKSQSDPLKQTTGPAAPAVTETLTLDKKREALAEDVISLRNSARSIVGTIALLKSDEDAKKLVGEYGTWRGRCREVLRKRLKVVEAETFMDAPKPRRYDAKLNVEHQIRDWQYKKEVTSVFDMAERLKTYIAGLEKLIQESATIDESRLK